MRDESPISLPDWLRRPRASDAAVWSHSADQPTADDLATIPTSDPIPADHPAGGYPDLPPAPDPGVDPRRLVAGASLPAWITASVSESSPPLVAASNDEVPAASEVTGETGAEKSPSSASGAVAETPPDPGSDGSASLEQVALEVSEAPPDSMSLDEGEPDLPIVFIVAIAAAILIFALVTILR